MKDDDSNASPGGGIVPHGSESMEWEPARRDPREERELAEEALAAEVAIPEY